MKQRKSIFLGVSSDQNRDFFYDFYLLKKINQWNFYWRRLCKKICLSPFLLKL